MEKGTLIKTYRGSRTTLQGEKYDTLLIFYRDENGEKKTMFYDRPTMDYYIIKDKNSPEATHPPLYIPIDKVEHKSVNSDDLYKNIAIDTGALAFYDNVKTNRGETSYDMKNLFKSPLLYGADTDLEDQYIAKFYRTHEPNPNYKLHKCYFDIETDIYHFSGFPDPDEAPCPICIVTLIDEKAMTSYSFILRNKQNEGLVNFEKDVEDFKNYMKDVVKTNDNLDMEFEFIFYDDEKELIKSFFSKVHEIDPDYCGGWNISFDIKTLQNRLVRLYEKQREKGISAKDAAMRDIVDPKYQWQTNNEGRELEVSPKAWYSMGSGKIGRRIDNYVVLDGVNWVDQMLTYGNVHAGEGKPDSYKLDYIANLRIGKEKLPYGPGETIRNQLYKNTKRFIEYNIRDVLLLLEIEDNTRDIEMIQQTSDITMTRHDKCFMNSIAWRNFINKYAFEQGLVMGTNKNAKYGQYVDKYEHDYLGATEVVETDKRYKNLFTKKDKFGAYVSNPTLNDDYGIEVFKGKPSKYLWDLVIDMDFSSLYPSIIRAFNLDSRNIVGKFYLIDDKTKQMLKDKYHCDSMFELSIKDTDRDSDDEEEDDDNVDGLVSTPSDETDDLCSVLTDSLISEDWSMIGKNFFDLPTTEELVKKLEKR